MRAIAECPLCPWLSPEWTNNQERQTAMNMWFKHRDLCHKPGPILHTLSEEES